MEKKVKVIGKIGNTEYQNNDRCKVASRFFSSKTIYTDCSHGNCPMVVRRWKFGKTLMDSTENIK